MITFRSHRFRIGFFWKLFFFLWDYILNIFTLVLTFEFKSYKLHFFLLIALCKRPAHNILLTLTRPNKKKFCSIFLHVVIWTWRRQSQRKTKLEDLPIFISRYDIFTEKKTFFFIYLCISSLEPCSCAKYLLCPCT